MKRISKAVLIFILFSLLLTMFVFDVNADGTFGKTDIGSNSYGAADDRIYAFKGTLPEDGDVIEMSWYGRYQTGTTHMTLAIYDDDNDEPNDLQGTSEEITISTTTQWWNFTCSPAISLTAGDYWLCWNHEGAYDMTYYYDTGDARYVDDEYDDGFPASLGAMSTTAKDLSIYATYTTAGAAEESFFGVVSHTFSVSSTRSWSFSTYGTLSQVFGVTSLFSPSSVQHFFGAIIQQFNVESSITTSSLRNLFGTIAEVFGVSSTRSWAFTLNPTITQTFGVTSTFVSGLFQNFHGTINIALMVASERSWQFALHSAINQVFAVIASTDFSYGTTVNFFGSVAQLFALTTERAWSFDIYGTVDQIFSLVGSTQMSIPVLNFFGSIGSFFGITGYAPFAAEEGNLLLAAFLVVALVLILTVPIGLFILRRR